MIENVIKKFETPWRVVGLGGTDHDLKQGEEEDFVFDVVDRDGSIICETDDKEVAEALAELPYLFYRLKAIAECKPAILCRVWEGTEVTCPSCENLIRGGKEIMRRLGVKIGE